MGYPREAVVELLIPAFLPFNLIKGGLNATITMILYKPIVTALRRAHLIETNLIKPKTKLNVGLILIALSKPSPKKTKGKAKKKSSDLEL